MDARERIEHQIQLEQRPPWRRWPYRVAFTLFIFWLVVVGGGVSIWMTGEGEYDLLESVYFSLITVSTVGYGELPHLAEHRWARLVSAGTIVFGLITLAFFQSTLTALFVEGALGTVVRRRRMQKKISSLENHFIVTGCGRVGRYVASELHRAGRPFVVIDLDEGAVHAMATELGTELLHVPGDATEDRVLEEAGIHRAAGLVCALSEDRDNLFVTLSARTLSPKLCIVAKVVEAHNEAKLLRAGATRTVSPQQIGGFRLASELIWPTVTKFLEALRLNENMLFEEILVSPEAPMAGKTLMEARIREQADLLVIGFHLPDDTYVYNPGRDAVLAPGIRVLVMGEVREVKRLEVQLGAA